MKTINVNAVASLKFFKPADSNNPIASAEKRAVLIQPKDYPEMYDRFYSDLSLFLTKLNSGPAKSAVNDLYNRKLLYIMKHLSVHAKRGIFGGCFFNGNKLGGIGLDITELDINPDTGETPIIDDCVYAAYFHYVRSGVLLNPSGISKDTSLHADLIQYMYYLLLKAIKFNILPKQKELLVIVCSYFFYRFHLGQVHKLALENTYKVTNTKLKDEIKDLVKVLEKYKSINDIFKAIVDFRISSDPPPKLMMRTLTTLKPGVFYGLLSTLDYLCGLAVASKYPFSMLSAGMVMSNLQSNIEKKITPYVKSVKFDVDFIKKLRK